MGLQSSGWVEGLEGIEGRWKGRDRQMGAVEVRPLELLLSMDVVRVQVAACCKPCEVMGLALVAWVCLPFPMWFLQRLEI